MCEREIERCFIRACLCVCERGERESRRLTFKFVQRINFFVILGILREIDLLGILWQPRNQMILVKTTSDLKIKTSEVVRPVRVLSCRSLSIVDYKC